MEVYNTQPFSITIEVLLITILFFFLDHLSVRLFQGNQRFQAIEFEDRPVPEKLHIASIAEKGPAI